MSESSAEHDPELADLFDDLLEDLLNGKEPDLAAAAARHPQQAHRVGEALALALAVVGRREAMRPVLAGYDIVRELGRGGMGTVYLARDQTLHREVALKVLPHSLGLSPHAKRRFLAEARALARVRHDHIIAIHQIVDDGDLLAFEMEFVDGLSLQHVLEELRRRREQTGRHPTLDDLRALFDPGSSAHAASNLTQFFVRLTLQIARALQAVHGAGFTHRDVKPSNILLRRNGQPLLADFGLVRGLDVTMTHAGGFAGTPVYAAPEQLRGDRGTGARSDVYSLAVTLYECITLVPPFPAGTTTELLREIESGHGKPLRKAAPHAPRDLETVVMHAMEVEPERRYAGAAEFADDLQRLLDLQPIHARPVTAARRIGKFLRRNRRPILAACGGALLVIALMVPLFEQVRAAGRAKDAAREHLRTARRGLLADELRDANWYRSAWGHRRGAATAPRADSLAPLQAAAASYRAALAADPDDGSAAVEHAAVEMVLWLRQYRFTTVEMLEASLREGRFRELARRLPPCTAHAAELLARGTLAPDELLPEIDAATPADRAALGLLSFLLGEFRLCEQAWGPLATSAQAPPFLDAGLGLICLADGLPEQAYLHLHQAQRGFAGSDLLAAELAEAALLVGDITVARHWLDAGVRSGRHGSSRGLVEADLLAATGRFTEARTAYEALAAADPDDPRPAYRLCLLTASRGELADATTQLDALIAAWPQLTWLRLDRARIALRQRDLFHYGAQVLAALDLDLGRGRSRGAVADCREILRIGGLDTLLGEALARGDDQRRGRGWLSGELPVRAFAAPVVAENFERLLADLHRVRNELRAARQRHPELNGPIEQCCLTVPLLLGRWPVLASRLPQGARLALALAPSALSGTVSTSGLLLRNWLASWGFGGNYLAVLTTALRRVGADQELSVGWQLARTQDRNGDGIDEVIVAAPAEDPDLNRGAVYVLDGNGHAVLERLEATGPSSFGFGIAALADLDGDGCGEIAIGAPSPNTAVSRGRLEIWSPGRRQAIHVIEGTGPGFGASVTGLGDCNGDGTVDFAVGTVPVLVNNAAQGMVEIYSGRDFELLRRLECDVPSVWFAGDIRNAGDVDGDGVDDLIVGGHFGLEAAGLVRVYSGATGALLHSWHERSPGNLFGYRVAGAGDVDEDGRADLAISDMAGPESTARDRVIVRSGGTGEVIRTLSALVPGIRFGASLHTLPATGGDYRLVIGATGAGTSNSGCVMLFDRYGVCVQTIFGPATNGAFGATLLVLPRPSGDLDLFVAGACRGSGGGLIVVRNGVNR